MYSCLLTLYPIFIWRPFTHCYLDYIAGDAGSAELVDTPITAEERVAIMESVNPAVEGGTVVNGKMETDQGEGSAVADGGSTVVGEGSTAAGEGSAVAQKVPEEEEPEWVGHLRSIDIILGGNKTIALHQEFLIRNNNSDLQVLKNTKVKTSDY